MNYSNNESMVRVDFFRPTGKWCGTESIEWDRYLTNKCEIEGKNSRELIHDTLRRCLKEQLPNQYTKTTAVCLEPCHENSYPLLIKI